MTDSSESEGKRPKTTPLPHMRLWLMVGYFRFLYEKSGIIILLNFMILLFPDQLISASP